MLILFFDGVGIGADDPAVNPFAAIDARRLGPVRGRGVPAGAAYRPLDATLGLPGLPQSATGQTTLYTGVNAARAMGRHLVGIPGPTLCPLLERDSLFHKLIAAGRRPTFANAYTRSHLEARRPRWSATTRMALGSGIRLRMIGGEEGEAEPIVHDYTGEWAAGMGLPVPRRNAEEAALVLAGLLEDHDLVLYEYFLTDLVAHRGTWEERLTQAARSEALVEAVLGKVDLERQTVVVISDHGNLEQGDDPRHTMNPVPLLAWGLRATELVSRIDSMESFTPGVVATVG
jgi:2,3-bisphosphoglycerate-independent phosphoglycerate mutase